MAHGFLANAYWSPGVARDVVKRAVANSVVVGLYDDLGAQIGMARAVTDRTTFAWIADVFVLPEGARRPRPLPGATRSAFRERGSYS